MAQHSGHSRIIKDNDGSGCYVAWYGVNLDGSWWRRETLRTTDEDKARFWRAYGNCHGISLHYKSCPKCEHLTIKDLL